ncbi:4-hydroxythreonine-4-phosphate dehydrogenase PdxA [Geminocystis sp. NIES-3709]|uniref:4-hydroxythreonine-4-phosphate dehydrogenase PdxA n=1 Tax=Geminocystis sp. NIES-3709 TaxID=1617448 RepID=UPI0005FC5BCE|nr:4-hydroxythreonine-4-phosphate dehydrogenase PdxA [Geminocystis sp. NIES-3709]BAQ64519.1 4-hydroxythreonine-4-phosphate dehydrogenase [Geminocystis sp. NIES-3709]
MIFKHNNKINLAITLGDPASIGSEVILKALANPFFSHQTEITIIGSRCCLEKAYHDLHNKTKVNLVHPEILNIFDMITFPDFNWGEGNIHTGKASFLYLEKAIELTLGGTFDGIVTAPIAKSLWQKAGYDYPGQTEVLAKKSGVDKFGMMFVAKSPHTGWILRTLLATTHIPLKAVADSLNPPLMNLKLDLLIHTLREDFNLTNPHIAIAGLNPHSGEDGKLGTEEKEWLNDWLESARKRYPQAKLTGLTPPDTLWVKPAQAWYHDPNIATADGFLALYHDQGLIPVKSMAFDQAINTTIGLPFVRTSPDHGTAFDIAGQGIANASSMISAIELAIELCQNRKLKQVK